MLIVSINASAIYSSGTSWFILGNGWLARIEIRHCRVTGVLSGSGFHFLGNDLAECFRRQSQLDNPTSTDGSFCGPFPGLWSILFFLGLLKSSFAITMCRLGRFGTRVCHESVAVIPWLGTDGSQSQIVVDIIGVERQLGMGKKEAQRKAAEELFEGEGVGDGGSRGRGRIYIWWVKEEERKRRGEEEEEKRPERERR
jgi:hypothetical protein